jgi:hypothetical protein
MAEKWEREMTETLLDFRDMVIIGIPIMYYQWNPVRVGWKVSSGGIERETFICQFLPVLQMII